MFICDCHCDTLTELYKKGTSLYDNDQHFDIKRQIELGGGLQFCAIFVPTHEFRYYGGLRYTLSLLDKYKQELKALQEKGIDVLPVLTKADAADVLNHKAATLLAIEEGGAIDGSLEALRMLYELGVRAMTLTWSNRNDIADGVNEECSGGGLTTFGRQVVAEMNRLGMLVDVSHTNERTFWDMAKVGGGPLMASHSNARALADVVRNLTDCQLLEIRDTNGIVGLNSFNMLVDKDVKEQTVDGLIRHADYIANKIGVEHLAFGFDFCEFLDDEAAGSFCDQENTFTVGLEDCTHVPAMVEKMKKAGFSDKELEMICRGNWMNLIQRVIG